MPFACPLCEDIAFEKYNQLRAHLMGKHKEEKENWPTKEECEIEEIPEGMKFVKAKAKRTLLETEEAKPTQAEFKPEGISDDSRHLHDLLLLHGAKENTVDTIVNLYDRLELYKDPRNLAHLLQQRLDKKEQYAIFPVMFEMFPERQQEMPYIMPQGEGAPPWFSQGMGGGMPFNPRPGMGGMGQFPGQYSGYPPMYQERSAVDKYIEYQMAKEMKEEDRPSGRRGKESDSDPFTESRFSNIEKVLEELLKKDDAEERDSRSVSGIKGQLSDLQTAFTKIVEEKEKDALIQPLLNRIESMERSHKEEMTKLLAEVQEKKAKGEETGWLDRFMEEREKRHEQEAASYREDMKNLTAQLLDMKSKEGQAYQDAHRSFTAEAEKINQAKDSARKELIDLGYNPRERDFEERVFDIVEKQFAPAVIGEVREARKVVQDFVKKVTPAGAGEELEQKPITDEEAERMSEVMSLEEEMKSISKKPS